MPDQTVPAPFPNTTATTTAPLTPDRQPPHAQTTHPETEFAETSNKTRNDEKSAGK